MCVLSVHPGVTAQITPASSGLIKTTDRGADCSGPLLPVRSARHSRRARAQGHFGGVCVWGPPISGRRPTEFAL